MTLHPIRFWAWFYSEHQLEPIFERKSVELPSLKQTAIAPENLWLEYDRFLLGFGLFSGANCSFWGGYPQTEDGMNLILPLKKVSQKVSACIKIIFHQTTHHLLVSGSRGTSQKKPSWPSKLANNSHPVRPSEAFGPCVEWKPVNFLSWRFFFPKDPGLS